MCNDRKASSQARAGGAGGSLSAGVVQPKEQRDALVP